MRSVTAATFVFQPEVTPLRDRRRVELLDTCDYSFEEEKQHGNGEGIGLVLDFCGFEHCPPKHSCNPNKRNNYVLCFVLDGEGALECEGREWKIMKDQSFILFPGETAVCYADMSNPLYCCWIGFHGELADRVVENIGVTKETPVLEVIESDRFETFVRLMVETKEMGLNGRLRRYAYMMSILSALIEDEGQDDRGNPSSQVISYVDYAKRFINNHYREKIRIQDLAQHIGISRSYLVKLMKRETGVSPQEYLIATRMKRASEFLISTSDSIRNVAEECGYDDALAFSKAFKAKYGMNPSDYRLRYRENADRAGTKD